MIEDVDGQMIFSFELVNSLVNGHHHLRHIYGTHLADMNIPPHLLCNRMSYGKIETTGKYYIAVLEDGIAELKRGIELL